MSDVERPANGGGKPGNGHTGSGAHGLPARNMADIARLFLEGARPLPARTPPARRAPPSASRPVEEPISKPNHETREEATTAVLGLASAAGEADSWRLLIQAAQGLAQEQATAVAVVGLLPNGSKTSFVVDVVGVESMEELPVVRTAQEAGAGESAVASDVQIARALHRLRPAVGLWIISAPDCEGRTFPAIASIVREWLLACPTDNDGLISGYQYLKRAWTRAGMGKDLRLSPTVYLISEDYAQAAVVHKRLRKAAQEFLGTDLALAGAGPIRRAGGVPVAQEPIRVLSVTCEGPEDAQWAAVLDELCPMTEAEEGGAPAEVETALDHVENHAAQLARTSVKASAMMLDGLAQVLDPEERAALAASFEEPGVVAAGPRGASTTEVMEEEEVASPPTSPAARGVQVEAGGGVAIPMVVKPEITIPALPRANPAEASAAPVASAPVVPTPVMPVPSVPVPDVSAARSPTIENPKSKIGMGLPPALRAFDVDSRLDRAAQWQAVERSIWDLSPRSALLDARPPMSWATETCISIDAAGRVNVWMLYREGASWYALREWANEHRNLLALTRRDLAVDKEAEVEVHLVLALEDEEATARRGEEAVNVLLRAPRKNVHLYRLRMLQWNGRNGVMVVPVA